MAVSPRKVAVVVNANARAVTDRVIRLVCSVVPPDNLFVSSSIEQSRAIVRRIIEARYDAVLTGGGDGTLVQFVSTAADLLGNRPDAWDEMPAIGVLKLGTGNSLAGLLGAGEPTEEGLTSDYWKARYTAGTRKMRFIEVEGRIAPFAGVGLDAMILNNYNLIKDRSRGTAFEKHATGPVGYLVAIGGMTIPQVAVRKLPIVTAINEGAPAWRVGPDGRRVGPMILRGETIYRGPAIIASVSRLDGFGYHFRLFPFAYVRDDRMHFRVCSVGVFEVLSSLHLIWRGEYFSETINDFMVDRISLHAEEPMPFQIGGDGEGFRSYVQFGLGRFPLRLLDFQTAPAGLPVGPAAANGRHASAALSWS
ncbi:MAG: diacylglycerol kinase family protein [Myxococcota bacterium]|nr:diacylglycerol kinase family protein [Myxococcota bacterium]